MKSLKEVIEEYNINLIPTGSGRYNFLCPFHSDHTPSCTLYTETDSMFCWVCSVGFNSIAFIARMESKPYKVIKEQLEGKETASMVIQEHLDGLHVVETPTFNDETNMSLSKYCRDLLYSRPELIDKVMSFYKRLDIALQKPIDKAQMTQLIKGVGISNDMR